MIDERLQLAFAGLHPDQTRGLLAALPPDRALRKVVARARSDRVRAAATVDAATRRRELAGLGIRFVTRDADDYPSHLADLPDAPDGLFVRGALPVPPGVAVVGTRRCTTYGRRLAEAYGAAIALAGWPLVSGLARGIDGAAHLGTARASGIGVAVLGCGLDIAYPPEHEGLANRLLDLGGAVVSEYPPGTPPEGWRFPPRNRIISGLAAAVVVVEANTTGGALITAAAALEQGTPVFAVPGDVGREASRGCNLLIRDGAHPVLEPADLVAELELVLGPVAAGSGTPKAATSAADVVPGEGVGLDALADRMDLPIAEVLATVSRWEADGVVERIGDTVYPARDR